MCGIIGIASAGPISKKDWLGKGRDTMAHRGPDSIGIWWSEDNRVGLGHRRLSIIDLSESGSQPMHDSSERLTIVFNGEIYNHRTLREGLNAFGLQFQSRSDTEVILAAYRKWGVECLLHLNGMFAFAIYDSDRHVLFLARDRAGEKPLFYTISEGGRTLCFASELKALLSNDKLSRHIDPIALDCYLAMGFVPGSRCILENFSKLPPAHAMLFDLNNGDTRIWPYWNLPEFEGEKSSPPSNENILIDEMEQLLSDAVSKQLVADVPVGIFLSGGVDSSIVTALAAGVSTGLKTFTIRFPGYSNFDETEHARLIANHFNTEHIELDAKPTTINLLPQLAAQYDEPIVDSSMIPTYLVCQLVKPYCKVVLSGDGGDELFGGYDHYRQLLWMRDNLTKLPLKFRQLVAFATKWIIPVGFKARNWLLAMKADLGQELPLVAYYFDDLARKRLLGGTSPKGLRAEKIFDQRVIKHPDLLQRATRTDFTNYLPEDILVKVDRASMLNSIEVRAPMLDYRVIEFAFRRVPSCLKATNNRTKIFLKRLAKRLLPAEFDLTRKQGFSIPLPVWLSSGRFRDFFEEVLLDQGCIFNRRAIEDLFAGQDRGFNNGERLFALVLFELWRRKYRVLI